jgi:hypothetical protein
MVIQIPEKSVVISAEVEEWQLAIDMMDPACRSIEPGDLFLYDNDFWEVQELLTKKGRIVGLYVLKHSCFTA